MNRRTWVLAFVLGFAIGNANGADQCIERLLDSIEDVETGGMTDEQKKNAVGDGGRSRGPYQISYAYYLDATRSVDVTNSWADYSRVVAQKRASRQVVLSYWRKYALSALQKGDAKILCRVHNGGPRGHRKASTNAYWKKVKASLR